MPRRPRQPPPKKSQSAANRQRSQAANNAPRDNAGRFKKA